MLRLGAVAVTMGALVACGGPRPLKESFVLKVDHGWSCGPGGWVGLDKHERIRVEADLPQALVRFPDYATGGGLLAYTGKHLGELANGCNDDQTLQSLADVVLTDDDDTQIDYLYAANDGTAELFPNGPELGVTIDSIVMHPDPRDLGIDGDKKWDRLDDVSVDHYELPSFATP